jgi:heme a synthase
MWVPTMDFMRGFTLDYQVGEGLTQEAMRAIHWTHRTHAIVVIILAIYVLIQLKRLDILNMIKSNHIKKYRYVFMGVLTLQLLTGISSVILNYPLLIAVLHSAGAALLILTTVWLWSYLKAIATVK